MAWPQVYQGTALKGTMSRDLLCLVVFVKQLLLVPLNILRKNFDFNTIIEELFDFFDSPVHSLPGSTPLCIHYLEVSNPRRIHYRGVSTPQCIHHRGVSTPRCIHVRESRLPSVSQGVTNSTPQCIHCRGVKTPRCIQHRV